MLAEPTIDLTETQDQAQISQNNPSQCISSVHQSLSSAGRGYGEGHLWWPLQVIEVNSSRFAVCVKAGEGSATPPKPIAVNPGEDKSGPHGGRSTDSAAHPGFKIKGRQKALLGRNG